MAAKEALLRAYFAGWLTADASVLPRVFAEHARYTESYGPVYRGLAEITAWFQAWNKRGRVLFWEIGDCVEAGDRVICTWYFANRYDDGCASFEGTTWARFDEHGKIIELREFASVLPHFSPCAEQKMFPFEIRLLREEELEPALALVWRVFLDSNAFGYSQEGIETFRELILCSAVLEKLRLGTLALWGCFDQGHVTGVAGVRDGGHICLLFVDPRWQRRGIATALLGEAVRTENGDAAGKVTVNAARGALPFYRAFGFHETNTERCVDGIRFIPMEFQPRQEELI